MSKIRLTPNASGTGTVTLTVPSTSTDRTVTLPDETGTVVTSESSDRKFPLLAVSYARDVSAGNTVSFEMNTSYTPSVDTHSGWNSSTHRYTPTVPGYYKAIGGAQGQDLYWIFCRPQRNFGQSASYGSGTQGSQGSVELRAHANNSDNPSWGTGIFAMDGTNDYLSLIGISYSGSSKNFDAGFLIVEYLRAL